MPHPEGEGRNPEGGVEQERSIDVRLTASQIESVISSIEVDISRTEMALHEMNSEDPEYRGNDYYKEHDLATRHQQALKQALEILKARW